MVRITLEPADKTKIEFSDEIIGRALYLQSRCDDSPEGSLVPQEAYDIVAAIANYHDILSMPEIFENEIALSIARTDLLNYQVVNSEEAHVFLSCLGKALNKAAEVIARASAALGLPLQQLTRSFSVYSYRFMYHTWIDLGPFLVREASFLSQVANPPKLSLAEITLLITIKSDDMQHLAPNQWQHPLR